jgi:hypothetical protein
MCQFSARTSSPPVGGQRTLKAAEFEAIVAAVFDQPTIPSASNRRPAAKDRNKREDKAEPSTPTRRRDRWLLVALGVFGIVVVTAIFFVPPERLTPQIVELLSALAWPYVALIAIVAFWSRLSDLLRIIISRVEGGSSISIAKVIDVGAAVERVPAAAPGEPVTLSNVALLHSTWFSEKDESACQQRLANTAFFDDPVRFKLSAWRR